jgi:hypothetical protein
MRRAAVFTALCLLALLLASQFVLPAFLEGKIADRLTEKGGEAEVTLEALPALRLLAADGDRIAVSGADVTVDLLDEPPDVFDRLDGFEAVDVRLTDVHAAPFEARSIRLSRSGNSAPYSLALDATASPRDVADFASERLGPLGGFLSGLAEQVARVPDTPVPIELEATVESDDGRARITSGTGSIAGIPAGPVATAIAAAIVARL